MLRRLKLPPLLLAVLALSGCQYDVLNPSGWVALEQRNLLIISTLLMLIVIIPVLIMSVYFPWKYRARREDQSDYDPEFEHSTSLEVVIWGVPILIVAALGIYTYIYTHRLDPYKPIEHLSAEDAIEVQAVSLDWKWLFIYPQFGVASVNELAIPAGRQVEFKLSSSTVMNTLSIPALGGMVYSMAGMQTKLHLVADHEGVYQGRSAHYSGPGFSQMTFETQAMSDQDFAAWVSNAKGVETPLTRASYLELEAPTIDAPVSYYSDVEDGLFQRIVGLCVQDGKVCMGDMMMQDMQGGGGLEGLGNGAAYEYDRYRRIDGFGNPIPFDPASEGESHGHGHDDMSMNEDNKTAHPSDAAKEYAQNGY